MRKLQQDLHATEIILKVKRVDAFKMYELDMKRVSKKKYTSHLVVCMSQLTWIKRSSW